MTESEAKRTVCVLLKQNGVGLITILRTTNNEHAFVVSYVKDGKQFFAVTEVCE